MKMNGGRSDASTSTDDIRGRPLCLFYFTHPFGVLSPDPPTITTAPDNITQAFINMEPVSPYFWSSSTQESYKSTSTSSKVSYDVGNVIIPKKPINLASVPKYRVDFNVRKSSVTSSVFSKDLWLSSSSSERIPRRILPPLNMPVPFLSESSDEFWTVKSLAPKFSLPPIEMPKRVPLSSDDNVSEVIVKSEKVKRVIGVKKMKKRCKLSGIRRKLTCLMQRAIKGRSPALQEVLHTIREAWTEPKSLLERCRALKNKTGRVSAKGDSESSAMLRRAQVAELQPRAGASPGLLRRRYSMPETIMRKYRLAQQRSESDDSGANTAPSRAASPASPSPPRGSCASLCEPQHRFMRRDRELMRKSALLRRLWARPNPCSSCCYCSGDVYGGCGRETRSLDGSRSELRPLSSSFTSSRSRESHMLTGWSTPKRQRLESPNNFHGSDEMIRTAMRNSYDRAEESRMEREARDEMSDSTFQSHDRGISNIATSSDTQFTESSKSNNSGNIDESSEGLCSECVTAQINSDHQTSASSSINGNSEEPTYIDLTLPPTAENDVNVLSISSGELSNNKIELQINEEDGLDNNDINIKEPEKFKIESPPYEILEIVVSETLNSSAFVENHATKKLPGKPDNNLVQKNPLPIGNKKGLHTMDLDEYVSNILVESLNSLTDQLESMNASIGSERKINIVEKEIKIKLQNTGVNTIVHLSPTSNNQIIFGNEELYNNDDHKDCCNNIQDHANIREEVNSVESNNNYSVTDQIQYLEEQQYQVESEPIIPHDNVNKAVLQQIQKLFQDEMQNNTDNYPSVMPGISHIEISNVDVFIKENADPQFSQSDIITLETDSNSNNNEYHFSDNSQDVLGGVGSGNYCSIEDTIVVPRFSAMPHSESMEVNTSSSEDQDNLGSECTSLVDSLDDPNSPRSMLLRRSFRRSELVRSAIDVLDLLPDTASTKESHPREKCEAFFIRIKDNDCDCEKENIIVADHMPEKIKERLYRRQRKRELRMETAKRKKVKQYKRELVKQKSDETIKSKKDVEKDCVAIMNALVNEVITKIAQEEYKYMRIKQKSNNNLNKLDNQLQRKSWKKDVDFLNNMESFKISKNGNVHFRTEKTVTDDSRYDRSRRSREQIHGKLSLQTHPPITPDDSEPKRIYQKSEFRDGNKCIEILEILEYVDTSQSSPETTNSDENLHSGKTRKSKIPVPIYERFSKLNKKKIQRPYKSSPTLNLVEKNNPLLDALSDSNSSETNTKDYNEGMTQLNARRASVPHETRSRSNSLRFKQVFDIIPEEKSSLSMESPDDINYNRRVSAPSLNFNENDDRKEKNSNDCVSPKLDRKSPPKGKKEDTRSIGTSPFSENDKKSPQKKNKIIMTSPLKKSAATSPMLVKIDKEKSSSKKSLSSHGTRAGWLGFYKPNKQVLEEEGLKERGSVNDFQEKSEQYDANSNSTVRIIETNKTDQIIIGKDKEKSKDKKEIKRKKLDKTRQDDAKERKKVFRESSLVRSLSDPQSADVVIKKDKKCVQLLSVEKGEETKSKLPGGPIKSLSSSDSDSDSGKSLLCSLAPKWLSVGNRQKRQTRKKSQESQQQNSAGGWSVTVAGNCYTALPADVEMRLSFPKTSAPQASQSDSGFGDECRTRRPIAAPQKSCLSKHCENCTCDKDTNDYKPILPPAARKMTVTLKKESSGSSILASKSMKKSTDSLPDVETYKASKNKSKSSVKMRKGYSLHCWLPGDDVQPMTPSNGLSVLGCAIIPELKPRVPTMSERDLTRMYTPRHYLRS